MSDYRYGMEKLSVAVQCLAGRTESQAARLYDAAMSALIRIDPAKDIPDGECRAIFEEIMILLREVNGPEGALRHSIDALIPSDLKRVCEQIVTLYGAMGHYARPPAIGS